MPTYRYITADVLTGEVLGELPLYGVYMDKQLNIAGNFTGTFRIGTHIEDDLELLNATKPRRSAIYVQRDGTTIWGGILWSRTFGSEANTIQLSGQTFESYLNKVVLTSNFINLTTNQLEIAINLINQMQATARSNIGISTAGIDTTGGIVKNVKVPYYDYKYVGEILGEIQASEDGFDWTIKVTDTEVPDQPEKQLVLGQPIIAPNTSVNAEVYDYPGAITNFYWPESGTDSGTDFILLGRGNGSNMLVAQSLWEGATEYPTIHQIVSKKGVRDQSTLNQIAQDYANTWGPDISAPTITLKSDREPEFTAWNDLGSYFQIELESPRFATEGGRKVSMQRMIGWELSVGSAEQSETIKLRISEDGESEE